MARIYIAEDDSDIRQILNFCLLDEGYEVCALRDGEAAWEQLVSSPPDLLVLDLMMPGMDGFEILEAMHSWGIHEATRVLVVTARASETDRLRVLELGADDLLGKPFDPDVLVERVRELLSVPLETLRAERRQHSENSELLSQLESLLRDS